MRTKFKVLAVLCAAVLLGGAARAGDDVPNFNKRGADKKEEEAFIEKVARTVVTNARTSAKDVTLKEYKWKEPKAGRKELFISAGYKGAATRTNYTADFTISLDTTTPDKWEVLSVDYNDNNKSLVGWNRKNVQGLVKKFNDAK